MDQLVTNVDTGSKVNAQYNVARPGSLPARLAHYQRRKMFAAFLAAARPTEADTILDIGVTSDRSYDHSNYLEAWYPHKHRITAAGIDEGARFLEDIYPGVTPSCAASSMVRLSVAVTVVMPLGLQISAASAIGD